MGTKRNALRLILHLIPISTPPSIDRNSAMAQTNRHAQTKVEETCSESCSIAMLQELYHYSSCKKIIIISINTKHIKEVMSYKYIFEKSDK